MGGAPPPRLAVRELTPLSPTMQPQLHIFSHLPVLRLSIRQKCLLTAGFSGGMAKPLTRGLGCKGPCRPHKRNAACRSTGTCVEERTAHTIACLAARARTARKDDIRCPQSATSPSRLRTTLLALAALVAVLVLAALAGCGSSPAPGTAADPAGAIPASAPLYAGAVVRPEGALKTDALAAGRTLTHEPDPYLRLLAALQTPGPAARLQPRRRALAGPHAGIFLSSLDASSRAALAARRRISWAAPPRRARGRLARTASRARSCWTPATPPRRAPSSTPRPSTPARTQPATAESPTRPPPAASPSASSTASP